MNKSTEKGLVPELRFPEFKNDAEWEKKVLNNKDIATFVKDREPLEQLKLNSYVSTENLLADYAGVAKASKLPPSGSFTSYKPNDVLISNIRPYLKKVWCADKIGAASNDVIVIRPNAKVSAAYMLHILKNDEFINFVMKGAKGVKMPRGDIASIKAYPVALPRLPEQQKIADCLSSLDKLVSANNQKLDALKAHKKGLMQQLFPAEGETVPELRFPEFENQTSWKKRSFSKLFEIGGGKDHKHLPSGNIPVYGSGGYMRSVNEFLYDGESACIGRKGTINKPMFLNGKFWTVDTLFYTHSFNGCTARFIYLLFQNIDWLSLNEAGGVPSLSKVIINKIEVMIPEIKEQHRITDCIDSLEELITAQSQKIGALKTHKRGLMQQLFPILIGEANAT
ncbi:type I restriction-modification system, specificity subunit S [Pseudoalteromonas distincta]|uniref:restriction endonuclease subunit S n=1 Tax=Pseudoalteromonas distincta TaxID=77608 RepID=UPI00020A0B0C|nr:restriction endonuclease subunit S [Pseudoalteromonas distincta]EGI71751.1 type I restriction-modification system, specificity subunit S [Pseudoalteromonas distincta]